MTVTKHDMEWLANALNELDTREWDVPEMIGRAARELLAAAGYRRSVCVIHPVDEAAYRRVRQALTRLLDQARRA